MSLGLVRPEQAESAMTDLQQRSKCSGDVILKIIHQLRRTCKNTEKDCRNKLPVTCLNIDEEIGTITY